MSALHPSKSRRLRAGVEAMLRSEPFAARLSELSQLPARRIINPLLSFLYHPDDLLKWRAVTAIGAVTADLADVEPESARVIMRRLIWSLNDESGGIGWGAPEAMGEIMARHGRMAEEYYRILVSYVSDEGNRLENEALERGALWGIGRLAQERPNLLEEAPRRLTPYLHSPNALDRGLAVWALGYLNAHALHQSLELLLVDETEVRIFEADEIRSYRIRDLAVRALGKPVSPT